jgi:probable rRNA maturation factor
MSDLHMKWMDESGPTDVLSFPMDEIRPQWKEVAILGDIVVCPAIAQSQALSVLHPFEHELAILSVHGLLHILGYDHAIGSDEKEMFALQDSLVTRWSA